MPSMKIMTKLLSYLLTKYTLSGLPKLHVLTIQTGTTEICAANIFLEQAATKVQYKLSCYTHLAEECNF